MICGLGTDLIAIARLEQLLQKFPVRGPLRLFTPHERAQAAKSAHPARFYAKRFAAKEAFVKALGIGMTAGVSWQHLEVGNLPSGQPVMRVTDAAHVQLLLRMPPGMSPVVHLSLTDTDTLAQATVMIEGRPA